MTNGVFSEYELDQMGVKFHDVESAQYISANCVGSLEEEMESKTITKMCRGVVAKTRSRGTGAGTLSISMHMPWEIFKKAYGMELEGLKTGVVAYGSNSVHKTFSIVAHVKDEDGVEKLKAYPNCIITTGVTRQIENGAEEVAEVELEVSVMPDEYGNGLYEVIMNESGAEGISVENWMASFTPEMVKNTVPN